MKKVIFKGIATALITPLDDNGVDYNKLKKLIEWQISEGVNALVICGTTGESATLSDDEHCKVIDFAVEQVNGRIPVIAGTGSNETSYAIELTRHACKSGVDGVLVVTPYYNKATQKGLVTMYNKIADASTVPLIAYNVPSRTGVSIEPKTYAELAKHENIVAFKEANGNISKIVETMALVGDQLNMYSGNDDQIVPLLSVGGLGCISVLSNVMPRQTCEICEKFFAGDIKGSAALQFKYHELISSLFCEVNPIPVKAAMSALGYCENYLRLPLTPMEPANYDRLINAMKEQGLL